MGKYTVEVLWADTLVSGRALLTAVLTKPCLAGRRETLGTRLFIAQLLRSWFSNNRWVGGETKERNTVTKRGREVNAFVMKTAHCRIAPMNLSLFVSRITHLNFLILFIGVRGSDADHENAITLSVVDLYSPQVTVVFDYEWQIIPFSSLLYNARFVETFMNNFPLFHKK